MHPPSTGITGVPPHLAFMWVPEIKLGSLCSLSTCLTDWAMPPVCGTEIFTGKFWAVDCTGGKARALLERPSSWRPFPAEVYYATAYWMPELQKVEIKNVLDKNGDAYGFYNVSIDSTGWDILEIRAGYGTQDLSNEITMFLAGYLEGYLTAL